MKRTVVLLTTILFLSVSYNSFSEDIMAYPKDRKVIDSRMVHWLMANKDSLPLDSIYHQLNIWADDLKSKNNLEDLLFVENEMANINYFKRNIKPAIDRL